MEQACRREVEEEVGVSLIYLGNRSCVGHPEWDLMPG